MLCIGHRGASGHEPENTLRSIRRALELGADGIEIDVRLLDGELIVFHDSRLDRTTNGKGSLSRVPFERLRELDAGAGERVPTLREVLQEVARRAFVNIELKGRKTARPVVAMIEEFVRDLGWRYEDFLVSSFHRRELRDVRLVGSPAIPLGLLLARPTRFYPRAARLFGVYSINPAVRYVTPKLVAEAHCQGWKVFPYTVNTPADIQRMRDCGVDGVFCDFPERVKRGTSALEGPS